MIDSVYKKCFEIYGIDVGLNLCRDIAKHRLDVFIEERQELYWILDVRERTGMMPAAFHNRFSFMYAHDSIYNILKNQGNKPPHKVISEYKTQK